MHPLDSTFRTFLLRLDPRLYAVLEKCAQDELRSVNAQIEYLLKRGGPAGGPVEERGGSCQELCVRVCVRGAYRS